MSKIYVALDLETTGLDAARDAIIEIGALRFDGDRVLDSYATFVNPGRKIPPFITELTGITDADVDRAPGGREAIRTLTSFVGRSPVVGHNIGFDLGFLARHGALQSNPAIDTFNLAGILVPHASRYSLANLVRELGIDLPEQTHRALDDAKMVHALFLSLLERAAQLSAPVLQELIRLGQRVRWGPVEFFSDAAYAGQRRGSGPTIGVQLASRRGGDAAGPLFAEEEEPEPLVPRRELRPLDLDALTALMATDGPLVGIFPEYEYRDQQVEMLQAVGTAFNDGGHLLVEAGTGTGKSLAYLLPAIEWAVMNRQRVVISTNTINLQEQLGQKDIPTLRDHLYDFRFQVLKGRSHYLCRQQFETMRRRGPVSDDEMQVLAKVLLWLPNTLDGDGDGLFLPSPGERAVWSSMSAQTEACNTERCSTFQKGECFFYRARARAESAHLIIVNHALLLADIQTQNRVLPDYELLIVDEAHHLERATTDSLHYSVSWLDVQRSLDDLLKGGTGFPGLLAMLLEAVQVLPRKWSIPLHDAVVRVSDVAERCRSLFEELFGEVETLLNGAGRADTYGARVRIVPAVRDDDRWREITHAWLQLRPQLAFLVSELANMAAGLEDLTASGTADLEAVQLRITALSKTLGQAHTMLQEIIVEASEDQIQWCEAQPRGPATLNSVPLHVGSLLREHLFDKKRSVIMTSATMRVDGSFEYVRDRLSAETASELAVGSPFDYESSALLYVVTDIPEPRDGNHQGMLDATLIDLFKATEGRALALFTAYSQLRTTAQAITGKLAQSDITVYAQGSGSSRAQLLENFKKGNRSVLLGTRSFWEGVDVPGDALSCLVIVKLPFDVPTDPIVSARAEGYDDAFN